MMTSRQQPPRPAREPIHRPLVWVLIALAIVAGIPWYLPAGTIDPILWHLPAWFWGSIGSAVLLSAVCCWACLTQWNLEEHEDWERAEADPRFLEQSEGEDR